MINSIHRRRAGQYPCKRLGQRQMAFSGATQVPVAVLLEYANAATDGNELGKQDTTNDIHFADCHPISLHSTPMFRCVSRSRCRVLEPVRGVPPLRYRHRTSMRGM